jgi:hypothetical protein
MGGLGVANWAIVAQHERSFLKHQIYMTIDSLKCWINFILIPPKLKFRHEIIEMLTFVVSLGCLVSALLYFFFVGECSKFCHSFKQELCPFKLVHSKWMNLLVYQMFRSFCNLFFSAIFFKSNDAFSLSLNICIDSWKDVRYMH